MPRVTLGIATYNRDSYLEQALRSSLAQDYDDFELLVVLDGTTNPAVEDVLGRVDDPRLRVVRHERNRGIAAAYNTFAEAGSGELIAMLGDDDVCMPDRLRRQVGLFDAHPDTGVVHGDATIIDETGTVIGSWPSRELTPGELMTSLLAVHNEIVDPTRMVHRRVHEGAGGYDGAYPIAQDFDFWLRAAPICRFRHCAGGPLIALRRHGSNTSEGSAREREIDDVERALSAAIERLPLRELVPELDWALLDPDAGERRALLALADAFERRLLPLPRLAGRMRERAGAMALARAAVRRGGTPGRRLVMTAYGWEDPGGGTTVPRLSAKALAKRGWEVTVFHAAVAGTGSGIPYEVLESEQDGVALVGVHNRPHALFDLGNPAREIDDPPIAAAFAAVLDRVRPQAVHFHNLHNLGASLLDHAAARGIPSYFTTHNYWLICPRAYLLDGAGAICPGPGDRGGDCAACVGSHDRDGHRERLAAIRARAQRSLSACLTVSNAVRETLLGQGYPDDLLDVVRQAMPHEQEIWERVGRDRAPGRVGEPLTVGFVGSAYPHKGPALLIEAAQRASATLRVRIHGEVPPAFRERLAALDRRGIAELCGPFTPAQLPSILAELDAAALPSQWWDCAPLAAAECLAARLPLLVPRLGGLAEAVRDGIDGLAFDGLDADALARALDRVALEPGLLERMQAAIEPPRAFDDYVDDLEAYYAGERPGRVAPTAAAEPAVRWQGDHDLAVSLSIVNREICRRLPGPVERIARDGARAPGGPPLAHAAAVEVRHQWPPDLRPAASGRLAVILPWEFGAVPREWVEQIEANVDELWVPSEHVRRMYLDAGIEGERVVAIANGVDRAAFAPDGPRRELAGYEDAVRFLFVGGVIWRKGHDVLLAAWREAFAGRDDVVLVIKDVGAAGVYRNGDRTELLAYAAGGERPHVLVIGDELSTDELAALYRGCDVLVHPYRGEGFAMPVLEAMACGLPVIATGGGPTDEFCPPQAGWRISATRTLLPSERVDSLATIGRPWVLEPSHAHLVALLRAAAADEAGRRERGAAGAAAAAALDWDAVAARYAERLRALAARPPLSAGIRLPEPYPLHDEARLRLLAAPAWRGADGLGELLAEWCASRAHEAGASLVLLADPRVDGDAGQLEAHVLAAAERTGADLDRAGDINILMEPQGAERDRRLHAAVDAYAVLHAGVPGHARLARDAGNAVIAPGDGRLAGLLEPLLRLAA